MSETKNSISTGSSQFQPVGESNKYSVDQFRYPENLMGDGNEFNGNKVLFFINVAEASRYSGTAEGAGVKKEFEMWDIPASDIQKNSGRDALQGVKSGVNETVQAAKDMPVVGAVANAAERSGLESSLAEMNVTAATMKRLSAAIALYMPNSITQGTSVAWSEEDFSQNFMSNAFLESVGKFTSEKSGEFDVPGSATARGAMGAGKAAISGATAAALAKNKQAQNITRMTPGNSKAEMLFQSVDFRSFDFAYSFSPKSAKEAENVMRIIRMFKHHMLPEFKDEAKFLYVYPSEFNIKYYKGSAENQYVEKQFTAVLTRINIDYTPNGQFNTFANGMPTQINMSLSFRELSVPTKETSPYDSHGV